MERSQTGRAKVCGMVVVGKVNYTRRKTANCFTTQLKLKTTQNIFNYCEIIFAATTKTALNACAISQRLPW